MQLIQKSKKIYKQAVSNGKKGREALREAGKVFTSSVRVDSVDIALNFITVYFTGMQLSYMITVVDFDPSLKKTPEEIEQLEKKEEEMMRKTWEVFYKQAEIEGYPPSKYGLKVKAADGKAKFLKELLSRGSGEIIETNSSETISEKTVVFIVRVLRDNTLSSKEKTYILKSKWYMHNYDPSEWPTIEEIKKSWENGEINLKKAEENLKKRKVDATEFLEKLKRIR